MAPNKRKRSHDDDDAAARTSTKSETSLTPGAVQSMVYGSETTPNQQMVVKLFHLLPCGDSQKFIHATVCDDEHYAEAIVVNIPVRSLYLFRTGTCLAYTVSVEGYVTSPANDAIVFLCITSCNILKAETYAPRGFTHQRPPKVSSRIQGGTAGSFLQDRAPLFSDDDLAGTRAFDRFTFHENALTTTMDFIAHYSAMKTLHYSSNITNTQHTTENYMTTIREFARAQLDRQKASLTTNSERVPEHQVSTVTGQQKTALEAALAHAVTRQELTPATLKQWHTLLCGGLIAEAGLFRKTKVQAGGTSFAPPEAINDQVEKFCNAIRALELRLDTTTSPVTLAAATMIGVLDIHPFADGNGRLARIATQWALRRAGLPFVVNIFATPAQRRDYVIAIQTTRRNMSIVARGNVSEETLVKIMSRSGLLLPLVQLVLEQVSRAVVECNKLVAEKSALALDESETKAARTFREKAAAGTCLICFDDRPNVATLCCGKAVHLNCIAQWLSNRNSCPQCRTELPSLPPRVAAAPPAAAANENSDTTSTVEDADDTTLDETESATGSVEGPTANGHPPLRSHQDDTTDETESTTEVLEQDDTTSVHEYETNDDTTEDTTNDTVEVPSPPHAQRRVFCSFNDCRNKPATDCSSGGCGRCCVLYGTVRCARHNV